MIEKHFTLSRKIKTPDSFFSIEPQELKKLVEDVRMAEDALGRVYYGLSKEEKKSIIYRRSLFTVKDIKKGEIFNEENIRSIRPAAGLKPRHLDRALGRRARRDIKRGRPLDWSLIA